MMKNVLTHMVWWGFLLTSSYAQECFTDWQYFRTLTITHAEDTALTDIEVGFAFPFEALLDSGKIQANAGDLRILDDSCVALSFFIDTVQTDSVKTVWVNLPYLASRDTLRLQVYYGQADAQAVFNGDSTFIFFDDFERDSIDPAKWEPIGEFAKLRINGGILEYASAGSNPGPRFKFVRTTRSFDQDLFFDLRVSVSNSNGFGFSSADSVLDRIIYRQGGGYGLDTINQIAYMEDSLSNGRSMTTEYPIIPFPRRVYHHAKVRASMDQTQGYIQLTHFENASLNAVNSDTFVIDRFQTSAYHFILSTFLGSQTIYLDHIWVRKPTPASLEATLGVEQKLDVMVIDTTNTDTITHLDPAYGQVSSWYVPASHSIYVEGLPAYGYSFVLIDPLGKTILASEVEVRTPRFVWEIEPLTCGLYYFQISRHGKLQYAKPLLITDR